MLLCYLTTIQYIIFCYHVLYPHYVDIIYTHIVIFNLLLPCRHQHWARHVCFTELLTCGRLSAAHCWNLLELCYVFSAGVYNIAGTGRGSATTKAISTRKEMYGNNWCLKLLENITFNFFLHLLHSFKRVVKEEKRFKTYDHQSNCISFLFMFLQEPVDFKTILCVTVQPQSHHHSTHFNSVEKMFPLWTELRYRTCLSQWFISSFSNLKPNIVV